MAFCLGKVDSGSTGIRIIFGFNSSFVYYLKFSFEFELNEFYKNQLRIIKNYLFSIIASVGH